MKHDDGKIFEVPLHRHLPSWWAWTIYGTIAGTLLVYSWQADMEWVPYLLGGIAAAMTAITFKVYNAFVRYANETTLKAALTQIFDGIAEAQIKSVHEDEDDAAGSDAGDEASDSSSKDSLIERYESVLELIQKTETIGEARDIAWRALEQRDDRPN